MAGETGNKLMIESSLPGRMRLRAPKDIRQNGAIIKAEHWLKNVEGVRNVFINPVTGSLLAEYDPDALKEDELIRRGRDADIIADIGEALMGEDQSHWPHSTVGSTQIIREFKKVDDFVYRTTRGLVDAKLAISLLVFGTGIKRAFFSEQRNATPWYTLLWYGYSSFMQWHNPRNSGNKPIT